MASSGPVLSSATPVIEVFPMIQGADVQTRDDWSGFSNPRVRRKLQNRLNQRSSRKRKAGQLTSDLRGHLPATFREAYERSGKVIFAPRIISDENLTRANTSLFSLPERRTSPESDDDTCTTELVEAKSPKNACLVNKAIMNLVMTSSDFRSFVTQTHIYPLSVDHALLTLLHFNLIRALAQNVFVLGLEPTDMELDVLSPWNSTTASAAPPLTHLPPTLYPTHLQRTVPHHPEIDVLPFAQYRDNLIRAGDSVDDVEICLDMVYGVDTRAHQTLCARGVTGARTGFIVWADPDQTCNWEIDEAFFLKWKHLFRGCQDVIDAANYWRSKRGEPDLVIEEEEEEEEEEVEV